VPANAHKTASPPARPADLAITWDVIEAPEALCDAQMKQCVKLLQRAAELQQKAKRGGRRAA
jgi:hypothetical protein